MNLNQGQQPDGAGPREVGSACGQHPILSEPLPLLSGASFVPSGEPSPKLGARAANGPPYTLSSRNLPGLCL